MTNRQDQPTRPVPSLGRITYDTIGFVLLSMTTIWITWGAETDREFVGAVLGVLVSLLVGLSALQGALARTVADTVTRRAALEKAMAEQGYTVESGIQWLERQPGSPTYKPGPY